mgnify:FL=1
MGTFFGFCVVLFVLYLFHKKVVEEQDDSGEGYIITAISILIRLIIAAIKSLISSGIEAEEKVQQKYEASSRRSDEEIIRELKRKKAEGSFTIADKGLVQVAKERGIIKDKEEN